MPRPDRPVSPSARGPKSGKRSKTPPLQGAAADRQARIAQVQKQAKSSSRGPSAIWIGLGVTLALIVGLVGWAVYDQSTNRPEMGAVVTYEEVGAGTLGREHVTTAVEYPQNPPVGGDHHPTWLNCGIYEEPVPNHHAVHALEHGTIWLTYDSSVSEKDLDALRALANHEFMLMSPNDGQEYPIMATAWGRQLGVESGDDTRLEQFIRDWRQGPQTPEPGAACTGGTSVDLVGG